MSEPKAFDFVVLVWEKAMHLKERILKDLGGRFEVLNAYEVRWSRELFSENLSRFYGKNLPPGSHKEAHCGIGPFLLLRVRDRAPVFDRRPTSKGSLTVHAGSFDAKARYREWSGGGHRIHTSLTRDESRHDAALLLGRDTGEGTEASRSWDGKIEILETDLAGARGWESGRALFEVLNAVSRYVVLRNDENLPAGPFTPESDIDLLTDDYERLCSILNGRRVFRPKHRVHHRVKIGGQDVAFDCRYVGDGYYDRRWQEQILKSRTRHERGFYVPAPAEAFHSLLYHAVIHKRFLREDYRKKLPVMAKALGMDVGADFLRESGIRNLLDGFLTSAGYAYTEPKDRSVYFNAGFARVRPSWRRRADETLFRIKNGLREQRSRVRRFAAVSRGEA